MSGVLTYKRKFVILKDDMTNIKGIRPKGHGRIEIKRNKVYTTLNVENGETDNEYEAFLIGEKNGDIVEAYLGKIFTNRRGKGRINLNFNIKNVKNTGLSIEKFNGIIIRRGTNILLTGYINEDGKIIEKYIEELNKLENPKKENIEIDTHEKSKIGEKEKKVQEEIEEIEKDTENVEKLEAIENVEEVAEDNIEEVKEIEEEIKEEKVVEKDIEEVENVEEQNEEETEKKDIEEEIEAIKEDIEKIQDEKIEEKIETEKNIETLEIVEELEEKITEEEMMKELKEKEIEEKIEEEIQRESKIAVENIEEESDIKDMSYYESIDYARRLNYKNKLNNYILSILRFFPYIDPFKFGLKGYDWWRIEYDSSHGYKGFLPFYNYLMNTSCKYPFTGNIATCFNLMRKYNHYLFGMYKEKGEVKYYLYGVPGKFTSAEHPFMGTTGFNTWFDGKEGFGYWIIYIDPLTGKVVFPLNPMTPLG